MRDLKRKIQEIIDAKLNGMWTAAIGTVTKVGTRNVDVQIKNKIMIDNEEEEFPIIRDVPVHFPHTANLSVVSPLAIDDVVLLIFTKYNSQGLLDSSNVLLSTDSRQFSLNDCICIPGFFLSTDVLPEVNEGEGIISHKSGSQIKFKSDGSIEIKASKFEVNEL